MRRARTFCWSVVCALSIVALAPNPGSAQTVTLLSNDPLLADAGAIVTDGTSLFVGSNADIVKLAIDGTGVATKLYTGATPCCVLSLTRIGTDLFWIDPNGDPDATAIFHGTTGGGAINKIYSGFATGQPIVDGSGLTNDGVNLFTADEVNGSVHRMNTNGSGITFINSRYGGGFSLEHLNRITESNGTLYIIDGGRTGLFTPQILSIPKAGGTFTPLHVGAPLNCPSDIAVGNGMIFVTDACANTIWQLPTTGGVPTPLVSGAPFVAPANLIFFENALYVSDNGNAGPGAVFRISFDSICETAMSQDTYVNGNTLTVATFHLRNPGPTQTSRFTLWLGLPGIGPVPLVNGSSLPLTAGFDQNVGPVALFPVSAGFPRGSYEIGCRLEDPNTGRTFSISRSAFAVQ